MISSWNLRRIVLLGVTLALLPVLASCGGDDAQTADDVPSDAIAVVGDVEISKDDFDRDYASLAKARSDAPDPPRYTKCIAAQKQQRIDAQAQMSETMGKDAPKPKLPKDSELKASCEQIHEQLTQQVALALIQTEVFLQAAEDLDVSPRDDAYLKKAQFGTPESYRQALTGSGLSEEDFLDQLRASALQNDVNTKVREKAAIENPTEDDARDYYEEHKDEFTTTENRSVTLVANASRAKAEQAKQALEDDASWKSVGKKFSTTAPKGVITGEYSKTQPNPGVADYFKAKQGEIEGPVKGELGWTVFEVTKITPSSVTKFETVKEGLLGSVSNARQEEASADFYEDLKEKTICGEDYLVGLCGNAPDPTQTTSGS